MKIKNYFAVSPALIKENFKMHWYIPALSFIAYFFNCIFGIIINPVVPYDMIQSCFKNQHPGLCMLMVLVPLVASCIVMSYQHSPEKAFAFNSQPFTRSKLFNTQILTGWIMMILPVVVTGLIYCAFYGSTVVGVDVYGNFTNITAEAVGTAHIYSFGDVLKWCFTETAIITFFYGLFVLAGSIVGTTAIQILGSIVFFMFIPVFILLIEGYCDEFLIGYCTMPDWMENIALYSNPIGSMVLAGIDAEQFRFGAYVLYLLAGILILVLAKFAVQHSKLEHVGDGMIFDVIEELSTWLVTVLGALVFGLAFISIESSKLLAVIGMLIGAVIAFAVTKIIINRTIKIFNSRNLKSFCEFIIILALIMAFGIFDIGGFRNKLPEESNIKNVDVVSMFGSYDDGWIRWANWEDGIRSEGGDDLLLREQESIDTVLALHRYIVDNKIYLSGSDFRDDYQPYYGIDEDTLTADNDDKLFETVAFRYNMKNGSYFTREFRFAVDEETIKMANDIVTLPEYKEKLLISDNVKELEDPVMTVSVSKFKSAVDDIKYDEDGIIEYDETEYVTYSIKSEDIDDIADAIDKDFTERNYSDQNCNYYREDDVSRWAKIGYNFIYAEVQIEYQAVDKRNASFAVTPQMVSDTVYTVPATAEVEAGDKYTEYISIPISPSHTHTLDTLSALGYFDDNSAVIGSGGSVALK